MALGHVWRLRTGLAGLLALDDELGAAVESEGLGLGVELANNLNSTFSNE